MGTFIDSVQPYSHFVLGLLCIALNQRFGWKLEEQSLAAAIIALAGVVHAQTHDK